MEDGLTIPSMTHERAALFVEQFCEENGYTDALEALQRESSIAYERHKLDHGGMLMRTLTEFTELTISSQFIENQLDEKIDRTAEDELFMAPSDSSMCVLDRTLKGLHGMNILSVCWCPTDGCSGLLATGSADKNVRLIDTAKNAVIDTLSIHDAGVTALDFHAAHGGQLLSGGMDGVVNVVNVKTRTVVHEFKNHTGPRAFVIQVKWARNGRHFATACYDHSSCLYSVNDEGLFELRKRFTFKANVESIAFTSDSIELIVGVRGDNYLHYFDVESFVDNKTNMNSTGDDHVSFTAMDIAVSPNGKFVLVATDKDRCILFRSRTDHQLQNFYTVQNDDLSNPRVCWDSTGAFIYATSQDRTVVVSEVASAKIVARLTGHTGIVRALACHPQSSTLASGSFDKTLKLWKRET